MSAPLPSAAVDLLEEAAGLNPQALQRWDELARAFDVLFPRFGAGLRLVAQARRFGLDPARIQSVAFSDGVAGDPMAWFEAGPNADRYVATPVGVIALPPRV